MAQSADASVSWVTVRRVWVWMWVWVWVWMWVWVWVWVVDTEKIPPVPSI